jgi:hypothetical protein
MPHEGVCVGGPMAGLTIETRSDSGFLAVDAPAGAAWVYYVDEAGRYVLCTEPDPSLIDEADGTRSYDPERGLDVALGPELDVVALPGDPAEVDDALPAEGGA